MYFPDFGRLLDRLRGKPVLHDLRKHRSRMEAIRAAEPQLRTATDAELDARRAALRARAEEGVAAQELLVETFALGREIAQRAIGLRPYDVQLHCGIALAEGRLAEMQTGEGKTLAAVLPACLEALARRGSGGVHVLTVNDYLARRDAEWMGPIYRRMGLTIAHVDAEQSTAERRAAYAADVTYVTAKQAGFDFLRDQLCHEPGEQILGPLGFAIVDEADAILLDDARVPLILAGGSAAPDAMVHHLAEVAAKLRPGRDVAIDVHERTAHLTDEGFLRAEHALGCHDLQHPENLHLLTFLNLAIHAHNLLRRDIDYIVRDGRAELVDENTGRVIADRRWPDGLQAALEAKEGLPLQADGEVLGSITYEHYLALYPKLAGMTATAQSAARELHETYGLEVVVIPPHRPCIRRDLADALFTHRAAKQTALRAEIARIHATGRPVLVGTASVRESEGFAADLAADGIACRVLNARNDAEEAAIVAEAGAPGAVTISTNMAGRGTDIRLGGSDERHRDTVVALGGLYVLGTNRHPSRRIDDQLRGRAGRQGDPGCSRLFVSLEDPLFEADDHGELLASRDPRDDTLDDPGLATAIVRAQRLLEERHAEIRKTLRKYTSLVEAQRQLVQGRRQETLLGQASMRLFAERLPERFAELAPRVGVEVLESVECRATLHHLDLAWRDHLAFVAELREGIQLHSQSGLDPLAAFHHRLVEAYDALRHDVDEAIVETLATIEITAEGADLAGAGLETPSSTWTYLLTDNPWETMMERFLRGITRRTLESAGWPEKNPDPAEQNSRTGF